MSKETGFFTCTRTCWIIGAIIGLAIFLLMQGRGMATILALIIGVILGAAIAWALQKFFCAGEVETLEDTLRSNASAAASGVATVASGAAATAASAGKAAADAAGDAVDAVAETASDAAEVATDVAEEAVDAAGGAAQTVADTASDAAKGAKKAVKTAAKTTKKTAKKATKKVAKAAEDVIPDYDKDGVLEGKAEGKKPRTMKKPRKAGADNLKEIKGIGPKLEQLCNSMGFYHFDQIAKWTPDEVAWVNANLEGFKGRVSRDNWVEQAKILAAGGETEFSQRVEDGKVY